jgi:DNA-binding PadR family transcriptional regulator
MSTNSFDLRELAGDLIGLVKDRAKDAAASVVKPDNAKIQTAVLSSIIDEAKNAIEITRAIALASAGTWSPTSGEIQQALTSLLAEKLVSSKIDSDRKVYSITKAGKTQLSNAPAPDENANTENTESRMKLSGLPDFAGLTGVSYSPEFMRAASKLAPVMIDLAKTGTKPQQATAAAILDETRHKLHAIFTEK